MCTSFTMLCSSIYAHSWHFTVLLVPDKLCNNEMLPCGNLICFGPCVTRCKIITCTKGIQGSINSPHFHKLVICGGVGELSVPSQHMDSVRHACLLSLQGDLIHDVTAVNYMTIQLTRFPTRWTLSHVTSCLLLIWSDSKLPRCRGRCSTLRGYK